VIISNALDIGAGEPHTRILEDVRVQHNEMMCSGPKKIGQGASLIISHVCVGEPNTHIPEDVGVWHTRMTDSGLNKSPKVRA
jgi:hypothetical protein